jgi:hypothetical protein
MGLNVLTKKKKKACYKMSQWALDLDSFDKRPEIRKMDMRFGVCNVRSLHWAGSPMTVAKELSKYRLDLVGVQEVRPDRGGTNSADEYIFFLFKGELES